MRFGIWELLLILLIVLLLFGPQRITQMAKSLGQSVKEFKKGASEKEEESKKI